MMIKIDLSTATPEEACKALGHRLRETRLAQGLARTELAGRAGVSLGAVTHLESTGLTTLVTLVRVARVLGMEGDLARLFEPRMQSIAQLERFEASRTRQRAPRRRQPA